MAYGVQWRQEALSNCWVSGQGDPLPDAEVHAMATIRTGPGLNAGQAKSGRGRRKAFSPSGSPGQVRRLAARHQAVFPDAYRARRLSRPRCIGAGNASN